MWPVATNDRLTQKRYYNRSVFKLIWPVTRPVNQNRLIIWHSIYSCLLSPWQVASSFGEEPLKTTVHPIGSLPNVEESIGALILVYLMHRSLEWVSVLRLFIVGFKCWEYAVKIFHVPHTDRTACYGKYIIVYKNLP